MSTRRKSSSRSYNRRKQERMEDIRLVLTVLLICVMVLVVGLLGVSVLNKGKNNQSGNESSSGEQHIEGNQTTGASDEVSSSSDGEESTDQPTESETEDPNKLEKEHVVWLDAGHGGHDLGGAVWVKDANGNYLDWNGNICPEASDNGAFKVREKEQNLQLTLLIQAALEEKGVTVLMTRTDDTFVETKERPALANETEAECFISLHRNFIKGNQDYNGIEIWAVNWEDYNSKPEKAKDQQLAELIRDELNEEDITQIRGIMRNNYTGTLAEGGDDYAVLWRSKMPALILEMGYMSNDLDNQKYEDNIESYAQAIADGIVKWLKTQE